MSAQKPGGTEIPLVLTVEEAARALRIGRSAAYEQARRYLATGGAEGLPVLRFGRRLRVPSQALDRLLCGVDRGQELDGPADQTGPPVTL